MKSGIIIKIDELRIFENKDIRKGSEKFSVDEYLNNFLYKVKEKEIKIEEYIKGNVIDVTKLSKKVFPVFDEIDFFISYSYKDVEFVNKLADFLSNLGFKVFVDSQNWQSVYELLKTFDDKICRMNYENYEYSKRNITTSNIYSMLSIALTKVISRSKYFILVESENSVEEDNDKYYTNSPWLEHELEIFNLIVPYGNIYSEITKTFTECMNKSMSYKWSREFDIKQKYFSSLKNEDLELLEKEKNKKEKNLEIIDECLLKNYKKYH